MPTFSGTFNYPTTFRTDLNDGFEAGFNVTASGTLALSLKVDAAADALAGFIWGRISGEGTLSNYSLSAVAVSDRNPNAHNGFPHTGGATTTIAGSSFGTPDINGNWTVTGAWGSDLVRFDGNPNGVNTASNGVNLDGTTISGKIKIFTNSLVGSPDVMVDTTLAGPAVPTLYNLAEMSADIEGLGFGPVGWSKIAATLGGTAYKALTYANQDFSEIAITIRGTVSDVINDPFGSFYTYVADLSFLVEPNQIFRNMVATTAELLSSAQLAYPNAHITLTGHSLGGSIAQLVGHASKYSTVAFDAPGAMHLNANLKNELAPALLLGQANMNPGANVDIRVVGDAISLFHQRDAINLVTLHSSGPRVTTVTQMGHNHDIRKILSELAAPGTTIDQGVVEPNFDILGFNPVFPTSKIHSSLKDLEGFSFSVIRAGQDFWIDPNAGTRFVFNDTPSSPAVTSIAFVHDPNIASYRVSSQAGSSWSAPQIVTAGLAASFGAGTHTFRFEALSASGQVISLPDGFIFDATFASAGQVDATLHILNGNPFKSDFNGSFASDILWRRADGMVSVWDDGQIGSAHILASISNQWRIAETGDFDGNGQADILWRNDNGAVSIWDNADIASAHIIANAGVVPNTWHISGTADFDDNGHSDILWRNDNGAVSIWDNGAIGGAHIIANTGVVPNTWHIAGTGDFDGNGHGDILWRNDNGAVSIWDNAAIGSAHIIANAGVVPNTWHIAGTGDFDGNGRSDILWRNDNGAVSIWNDGQIGKAHIIAGAGVVPNSWHIDDTGDFNGNGHSDILWRNDNGAVSIWDDGQIGNAHILATIPNDWHIA